MSKKHRNRNASILTAGLNNKPVTAPSPAPLPLVPQVPAPTAEAAAAVLSEAHAEAAKLVPTEERPSLSTAEAIPATDPRVLQQLAEDTRRLVKTLKERQEVLDRKLTECDTQRHELENRRKTVNEEQQQLAQERSRLVKKEAELRVLELDAEAGFAQQLRRSLDGLNVEAEAVRQQLLTQRQQLTAERVASDQALATAREGAAREREELAHEHRKSMAAEQEALRRAGEALEAERRQLRQQRNKASIDQEILDEEKQALEERVKRLAARAVDELSAKLGDAIEARDQAQAGRDELQQRLRKYEAWQQSFGGRSPGELDEEIQSLKRRNAELKEELDHRPGNAQIERLHALEQERLAWEHDRLQFMQEKGELTAQLGRLRSSVTEKESLRDVCEALQTANQLLRHELKELKDEMGQYTQAAEGRSRFPASAALDEAQFAQTEPLLDTRPPDLKAFAADLRHRLGWDPQSGKELYYEDRDVRAFLGGLAMSPLHILQGISGTGKTSLPRASP